MLYQYVKFFQRTVSNEFIMWLLLRTGETMLIWDLFSFFFDRSLIAASLRADSTRG